ncbi:MAG: sulfotransferase [Candidatus Eremiobacteraeota bacterium]|nr:sulfotransferase [Candidatus Eremiobacteraeota bacterium]MBC5826361.1 sulfotransferase [Candidatus Eremiobacteraeota bacterium]
MRAGTAGDASDSDSGQRRKSGHNIVFIVGCPRSGTTWLQRQLACHRAIKTGQESHLFSDALAPLLRGWRTSLRNERAIGLAGYFTQDRFDEVIHQFLDALLEPMVGQLEEGQLFLEKSPAHSRCMRDIVQLLPQSRFIHVIRDARDVVASCMEASRGWGSAWAPRDAGAATALWLSCVGDVRGAAATLQPRQFHEVRYEDARRNPQRVLKGCAAFLSMEWSDDDIERAVAANTVAATRASGGTPIPLGGELKTRHGARVVEPAGFVRTATIGRWKTDLTMSEKYRVWRAARAMMAQTGYAWPIFLR